jgi:hypothetical protein
MDFVKKNILSLVILGFFAWFFFFQRGNIGCTKSVQTPDTVYSKHTEYVQQPPVTIPQYQPIIIESRSPTVIPQPYQPSERYEVLIKQYQEILSKFLAQNTYRDSISLKDSSGLRVGVVNLNDVVSENMIKSRNPSYQLTFPHTIETMTITKYGPVKRQFFIGGEVKGSQTSFLKGGTLGVLYKDRKDKIVGLGAGWMNGEAFFEAKAYWKISLSRK